MSSVSEGTESPPGLHRVVDETAPAAALYTGKVFHKRFRPASHTLEYRVFSLLVDIDRVDEAASDIWCFSRNRWNLYSFHDSDFGDRQAAGLRDHVIRKLSAYGLSKSVSRIELLCYPRIFGYAFNPLSVFFCYGHNGSILAILYEVHNTFGETHSYVIPVRAEVPVGGGTDVGPSSQDSLSSGVKEGRVAAYSIDDGPQCVRHSCMKKMHVSPFAPMGMQYRFNISCPADSLCVAIQVSDADGLMLTASFKGRRTAFGGAKLLRFLIIYPIMTVKITVGIHWEALRLWCKRVPWFPHPKRVS